MQTCRFEVDIEHQGTQLAWYPPSRLSRPELNARVYDELISNHRLEDGWSGCGYLSSAYEENLLVRKGACFLFFMGVLGLVEKLLSTKYGIEFGLGIRRG